jgi:hypothetical protein
VNLMDQNSRHPVTHAVIGVPLKGLLAAIALGSALFWGIGVARYAWVTLMGTDTILGNMFILDLNREISVSGWYSAMIIMFAATLLFLIAWSSRVFAPKDVVPWFGLGLIFAFLSLDEDKALHETLVKPMADRFELTGIFTFGWVLVVLPLFLLVALVYLPFVLKLPRRTAVGIFLAAAIYVFGAIGMEMASGPFFNEQSEVIFNVLVCIEEGLELVGMNVFIYVLLDYLQRHAPAFSIERSKAA